MKRKRYQNEISNRYYDHIQLYSFHKTELLFLIDEIEIEGNKDREELITSFKRTVEIGIMTKQEAADFVIFVLNSEGDRSCHLAEKCAKYWICRECNREGLTN